MRRKNPYPGVSRLVDRHGKTRWRFRKKSCRDTYINHPYGSAEFNRAYELARQKRPPEPTNRAPRGSFDWLIERYYASAKFRALSDIRKKNSRSEIERFRAKYGRLPFAEMQPSHIEKLMDKKADRPSAANALRKTLSILFNFAIGLGVTTFNPAKGVDKLPENPDGFHTWTDNEIEQFKARHAEGSKARLAMLIGLRTGAARQDAARMGRGNLKNGWIKYTRHKNKQTVDIPLHPELAAELDRLPADQMVFLVRGNQLPFSIAGFGNWFRDRCNEADLRHCSLHGLRKAGAKGYAEADSTEFQVMAFLGDTTPEVARKYVKSADRKRMAKLAYDKLLSAESEQSSSNPVERLDNHKRKPLKHKDK